jgi:hypothetical protein
MEDQMSKPEVCKCCGQRIQQAHKESMDKTRLLMLKSAAQHVISTGINDFKKRDLGLDQMSLSAYGNFGRIRYHGLITPVRDKANRRIKGRWLITRNGWAFLRGEFNIPKYVLVKNNSIESRSDTTISVRDVYYGSETIQTTFEYFDEDGKPVGARPVYIVMPNLQQRLI